MRALCIATVALATGCSCSQDYTFRGGFGDVQPVPSEDAPAEIGPYLDFDTAPEGERLTMAYYDGSTSSVGYAVGTVDDAGVVAWSYEIVDGYTEGRRGKYVSQATAADGTVWVAYLDDDVDGLRARKRIGGGDWEEAVAVDNGGLWTDMAMVGSRPVVVHTDEATGALRLSTLVDGAWESSTIYQSTDTAGVLPDGTDGVLLAEVLYPKILVEGDELHVVVYDAAQGQLHLLSGGDDATDASDFSGQVVEGAGAGAWPSILLHDDDLVIAYQHVANQVLRLAVRDGAGWQIETVDSGPMRGADTELYVDAEGDLKILYFDGWDANLLQASEGPDGWTSEILRGQGTAAGFHNVVGGVGSFRYAGTLDYTTGDYEVFQL